MKRYYLFVAVIVLVAAAAIGSNILLRWGPAHDTTVVADLNTLQTATDTYYLSQNKLPATLSQVNPGSQRVKRPLSEYSYARLDSTRYQLCATFLSVHHTGRNSGGVSTLEFRTSPDPDEHGRGRQCFTYTVIPVSSEPTPSNR